MLSRPEWFESSWWLSRLASRWALLAAIGIAAYAVFLRCWHLFNPHNYYVLSADSYFFHWLARRIMAGEGPPPDMRSGAIYTLYTGLAYPLAYIAKAVESVFNLSSAESLDIVCKFVPPLLGIISMVILYLVVRRIWNRKVGLFSALAWAAILYAVFVGAAGYIDRDGLSMLLIMLGALAFYLSKGWHFKVGSRDLGWVVAALVVLCMEALLYLEWTFMGPLLLLVVIVVYFLVKFLFSYIGLGNTEQLVVTRLKGAAREANWLAFAAIIIVNIVVIALSQGATSWLVLTTGLVQAQGNIQVEELRGLSLETLLFSYGFFLIPIAFGLYVAWKKRSDGAIFFTCWFLSLLILSLFASRVLFFATPAAAVLSGLGLAFLWDWRGGGQYQMWKKVGVAVLLVLLILVSSSMVPSMGLSSLNAVDEEWQDALTYLRQETPQDALIMTQWGWGFWILDLGQRKPVMDNGFYGYDDQRMHDVGVSYVTTDPSEAVQMMRKYNAGYLIFSKLDLNFTGIIMGWAGLDVKADAFPEDSLVARTLSGEFESGGGLEVVYRSVPQGEVVILGLTN